MKYNKSSKIGVTKDFTPFLFFANIKFKLKKKFLVLVKQGTFSHCNLMKYQLHRLLMFNVNIMDSKRKLTV